MDTSLQTFSVDVTSALKIARLETTFLVGSGQLIHRLHVQDPHVLDACVEHPWGVTYCGLERNERLYRVIQRPTQGTKYAEPSFGLLSENDFGVCSLAKVLSVPVFTEGSATASQVSLIQDGKVAHSFKGAYLFVNEELRELFVVMVSDTEPMKAGIDRVWIDLDSVSDDDLSFVLRCVKAAGV